MDRDWAGLPKHILDSILEKLALFKDCLRFGAVCRSWHSILRDNIPMIHGRILYQHEVPLLLFPDREEDQWSIYNIMNNQFLDPKLSFSYNRRFSGSSKGWLVVGNENHTVTLHRPEFIAKEESDQAGISFDLPCLFPPEELEYFGEEAYEYHVIKALITADPVANPDNCTIVMTFGGEGEIAFIRYNKDTTWIKIEEDRNFRDILYYKNKIYALGYRGNLISLDREDPSTIKRIVPDLSRICG